MKFEISVWCIILGTRKLYVNLVEPWAQLGSCLKGHYVESSMKNAVLEKGKIEDSWCNRDSRFWRAGVLSRDSFLADLLLDHNP